MVLWPDEDKKPHENHCNEMNNALIFFVFCNARDFKPFSWLYLCKQIKLQKTFLWYAVYCLWGHMPTGNFNYFIAAKHFVFPAKSLCVFVCVCARACVCTMKQFNFMLHSSLVCLFVCHLSVWINFLICFCSHTDSACVCMGHSAGHNRAILGMRLSVLITKQLAKWLKLKVIYKNYRQHIRNSWFEHSRTNVTLLSNACKLQTETRFLCLIFYITKPHTDKSSCKQSLRWRCTTCAPPFPHCSSLIHLNVAGY